MGKSIVRCSVVHPASSRASSLAMLVLQEAFGVSKASCQIASCQIAQVARLFASISLLSLSEEDRNSSGPSLSRSDQTLASLKL